ncbi:unnamed protein product [Pedinophyceae sp. YPF-701]|nr:unnamed protein product [Pedinophyceae sp. YPF-701]
MPPRFKKPTLNVAAPGSGAPGGDAAEEQGRGDSKGMNYNMSDAGTLRIDRPNGQFMFSDRGLVVTDRPSSAAQPTGSGMAAGSGPQASRPSTSVGTGTVPPAGSRPSTVHYTVTEKNLKVVRNLGSGACSVVHKAFYPSMNRFVAVKRINWQEADKMKQMMIDVEALCRETLPGVVQFLGAFMSSETGQLSVVLEYMDGGSLADLVKKVGKVPEQYLGIITADVLRGMAELNRRHLVHRDIKPANILVSTLGTSKIADFGIASVMDNTLAVCHTFTGTVTYMSPERINSKPYSFAADIWSLGLTLLECAMGRYPYDASAGPLQLMIHVCEDEIPLPPDTTTDARGVSPEFRDFLSLCMRKDPAERAHVQTLLKHPWVQKYAGRSQDLARFVSKHVSVDEKLSETAMLMVNRSYMFKDAGRKSGALARLAKFYAEDAHFTYEAEMSVGASDIKKKLEELSEQNTAFGGTRHEIQDLYSSRLLHGKNMILVYVKGKVTMLGAASALGRSAESTFVETFIIDTSFVNKDPNQGYYGCLIRNQIFRLLPSAPSK